MCYKKSRHLKNEKYAYILCKDYAVFYKGLEHIQVPYINSQTGHGTMNWFQIEKEVRQGCILSPSLFNSYAEYIMRNAGLNEAQAGIKIAKRNINNLRYADDTTLMAESEEELKNLLMKVKECKSWFKTQHSKN